MEDRLIHIKARKIIPNEHGVIKITPKAYLLLADVVNESGGSIKDVASNIIVQAIEKGLITYDREV